MADKKVKVTLVKSSNGIVPKNKKILEALGLHKVNSSNILPDNDATRGMLRRVDYLVKVEEA